MRNVVFVAVMVVLACSPALSQQNDLDKAWWGPAAPGTGYKKVQVQGTLTRTSSLTIFEPKVELWVKKPGAMNFELDSKERINVHPNMMDPNKFAYSGDGYYFYDSSLGTYRATTKAHYRHDGGPLTPLWAQFDRVVANQF
jgi:hypothetical protein